MRPEPVEGPEVGASTDSARLLRRWAEVLPNHPEIGEELLGRYAEPHRRYHTTQHLADVLDRIDELAGGSGPTRVDAGQVVDAATGGPVDLTPELLEVVPELSPGTLVVLTIARRRLVDVSCV